MSDTLVLPTFVVIGSMKSGTTTLQAWLDAQPDVEMAPKEPNFFSRDEVWARGLRWYSDLFEPTSAPARGDVSPSYTNPLWAERAAARMHEVIPDARIVYLLRHPVDRLRSHYLHQVRRARESRSLVEALADPNNPYVARSRYLACMQPYIAHFPKEQIRVERLEDLVVPGAPGWTRLLEHLGLPHRQPPGTHHYIGAEQPAYTRPLRWLADRGRLDSVRRLPAPVRAVGKAVALRRRAAGRRREEEAALAALPTAALDAVWRDIAELEAWVGRGPLWPADDGTGRSRPV
ncbi:MAG: hypothetical protein QOE35_1788 [Actinomycetota bacterium]